MKPLRILIQEAFDPNSLLGSPSVESQKAEMAHHLKLSHYHGSLAAHQMNISRCYSGLTDHDPENDDNGPDEFNPIGSDAVKHYRLGNKHGDEAVSHYEAATDIWQKMHDQGHASKSDWSEAYHRGRHEAGEELDKVGVDLQ